MSADVCGGEERRVVELGGKGVGEGALVQFGVVAPVSMDNFFSTVVFCPNK